MFLSKKSILLISPEPWDHLFVSKHHYAIELAKRDNKVFFLNPPGDAYRVTQSPFEDLAILNYKGFAKGLHYFPKWLRKIEVRRIYGKIQDLVKVRFDIIWSFDNSVFYDFDLLPASLFKISHIVDLNQDFQTERASTTADLCFGVIPEIVSRHKRYSKNTYLITHGVKLYANENSVSLPGSNSEKVLYFGNLAMPHLNWSLLELALKKFPSVDFILLGSNHEKVPIETCQNLWLIPPVKSEDLPAYMKASDVLILFYTELYLSSYASPHKMLEYLSSGKPIVSMPNFKSYEGLVYQSNNIEKWLQNLALAIQERDTRKVEARQRAARINTYAKKVSKIEAILKKMLG